MLKPTMVLLAAFLAVTTLAKSACAAIHVGHLRCEYRDDPTGIDILKPRLSWTITSEERGVKQSAYQILAASSLDQLAKGNGDIWNSLELKSDQSVHVEYAGKPLASGELCYWKVRVRAQDGSLSQWSRPSRWSMGLLKPEEWKASWIGYDAAYQSTAAQQAEDGLLTTQGLKWVRYPEINSKPGAASLFRKTVVLPSDRKLKRAMAVLYADNECAAYVNGKAVGNAYRWDRSAKIDITSMLHGGMNLLALRVTENDLLPPSVVGKFNFQFESGEDLQVAIDGAWKASQQSAANWETADFDDAEWGAAQPYDGMPWRGPASVADLARVPAPYLRKEFSVVKTVRRATIYATALGVYELHLNGKRVGSDVLTPGWTEFRKRVYYQTYDVTGLLRKGDNSLGAILGDGWYASDLAHMGQRNHYGGRPRLLVQMVLEMSDGTRQILATDSSWKASFGPILHADLLMGCEYDSRLEMTGWDLPGFRDSAWSPVVSESAPNGETGLQVQAAVAEPSRALEALHTKKVTQPSPGNWTFDLGQNMVGWVRLKIHGAPGQRITLRHGEMLNPDGTVYTANLRSCPATDFYILSGKGEEVLEPYFTFHGFRYVEIRGLTEKPGPEMVTGIVVHSDMERTGEFACSDPLVNKLYSNIIWGQKGNYLEIPTDCPQRDERMGWTGDTQFFAPTAAYNYNIAPFFTRWLTICDDDQNPDGTFPHVVPDIMGGGGATAWGDADLLCTYNLYRTYGDTRVISTHFAAMERYMRWLDSKTQNGITNNGGFGDWLNLGGGADGKAIDTAYHAHLAHLMSIMSAAIGRSEDAQRYSKVFANVKAAFAREYVQPDGSLRNCSETGYALAFTMDLLSADVRSKAADKFVAEIARFDYHLATGFIGTPRLLPGLDAAGRDDMAYRLLLTKTYPSWLYQVTLGASTMWERWNGWTPKDGFGDVSMNSFNHYAFGSVGEYLYSTVGGIRPGTPGYQQIVIRPAIEGGLSWAKTSFKSLYGVVATSWQREGRSVTLDVNVPCNTTAIVYVPGENLAQIYESGAPLSDAEGITVLRQEVGLVVLSVGSGKYAFSTTLSAYSK